MSALFGDEELLSNFDSESTLVEYLLFYGGGVVDLCGFQVAY